MKIGDCHAWDTVILADGTKVVLNDYSPGIIKYYGETAVRVLICRGQEESSELKEYKYVVSNPPKYSGAKFSEHTVDLNKEIIAVKRPTEDDNPMYWSWLQSNIRQNGDRTLFEDYQAWKSKENK